MTSSGTTIFDVPFTDAIEEAWERCGLEVRAGYDMLTSRRSINLLMADWSNRGLNMWLYESRTQLLTYNVAEYALGSDIIDVIEQVVQLPPGSSGPQAARINMTRVSVSTQATRTNPEVTGRPTEVFYQRLVTGTTAHIWPLPDGSGPYTLVYWVLRRIEDAGAYTNTADMPFRFLPAFISGLAFYIAQKRCTNNPELIMRLEADYEKTWLRASEEDRERATLLIQPRGSAYRVGLS